MKTYRREGHASKVGDLVADGLFEFSNLPFSNQQPWDRIEQATF